jgi:hypothetical protein
MSESSTYRNYNFTNPLTSCLCLGMCFTVVISTVPRNTFLAALVLRSVDAEVSIQSTHSPDNEPALTSRPLCIYNGFQLTCL